MNYEKVEFYENYFSIKGKRYQTTGSGWYNGRKCVNAKCIDDNSTLAFVPISDDKVKIIVEG